MREQGVVSPPTIDKKKQSVNLSRRDDTNDNTSSSNGRRRPGGLAFEGKSSSAPRPGDRFRGAGGNGGLFSNRDQKVEKKKSSDSNGPDKRRREEGEEEEAKAKPSITHTTPKREDDIMVLHWGHKKRPRCSRVDESSVLSRKTVRVKAEKVVGAAAVHVQVRVAEKRAAAPTEWRLKPSATPAVLRSSKPDQKGGGGKAAAGDAQGEDSRGGVHVGGGGGSASGAPVSPEKHDTVSTRTTRNPNTSPLKEPADPHNLSEIAQLKLEVEWPKIVICLSRKEKEEDFFSIKGTKLPQRPKRRAKAVEKALHYCSPGTWLTELSRSRYDVREKKCVKKRPRGLKAMESMESDSD